MMNDDINACLVDSIKFIEEIDKRVKAKIRELRRDGVVAMSIDSLWLVVSPEQPKGTNAAFHAKEIFAAYVQEKFGKFIYKGQNNG